jgi:hypothetical protein
MDNILKGQVQSFLDNRANLASAISSITLGTDPTPLFAQFAELHAELLMLALTYSAMVPDTQREMMAVLNGATVLSINEKA